MKFYTVKDAECDFCNKKYKIVTQVNEIYICKKCANIIHNHCIVNERAAKKAGNNDR